MPRVLNILIADDNIINQKILMAFLRKQNHLFKVANNGLEAVNLFKNEVFDCVLMDIAMPKMDGLEATKLIRKSEGSKEGTVPIIAITASAPEDKKEFFIKAGMNDYIPKPVDEQVLIDSINDLCDNH